MRADRRDAQSVAQAPGSSSETSSSASTATTSTGASSGSGGGDLPIASYALTLDLLEGELADALAAGIPPEPGSLPLRDRYLPDLRSVLGVAGRLCAGGALALCAFARPARRERSSGNGLITVMACVG